MESSRTTLALDVKAYRIARLRAKQRSISLGKAVSELICEADVYAPKTRIEHRANGMPVLMPPAGTPVLGAAAVRQMIENDE